MDPGVSDSLATVTDRLGRRLRDLRVSVTDRCNFRCRYCMPREVFGPDFAFLPRSEILHFGEIRQLVRVIRRFGLEKVRLTGGEPLLRKELPRLVSMLREVEGIELAMTTNGALLERMAAPLAEAGLDRVTVSLDSLDPEVFARMNDTRVPIERVLAGIDAAVAADLAPVKINAVVRRGINDDGVVALARHFHGTGVTLRFIEFMDVGTANGWRMDEVVSGREILRRIDAELPLEPLPPRYPGEVATRYRYRDGGGEVGVITSVTEPFCGLRRQPVHLSLRRRGRRSQEPLARRRQRRRARGAHRRHLAPPRRPLLGDPERRDPGSAEGGDVVHRRVRGPYRGATPRVR